MMNLSNYTTPQLRNILKNEKVNYTRKNSKKTLIKKILRNRGEKLVNLPTEILHLIGNKLDVKEIASLCRSSKFLRKVYIDKIFIQQYLSITSNNKQILAQEIFHNLLSIVTAHGDIEFFLFLWNTPIYFFRETLIMKELRSLFICYKNSIINDCFIMADIIYKFNPDFLQKRILRDLNYNSPQKALDYLNVNYCHTEWILESCYQSIRWANDDYSKHPRYWFRLKYKFIHATDDDLIDIINQGLIFPRSDTLTDVLANKNIKCYNLVKTSLFRELGKLKLTKDAVEHIMDHILYHTTIKAMNVGNEHLAEILVNELVGYRRSGYEIYIKENHLYYCYPAGSDYGNFRTNYFSSKTVDAEKYTGLHSTNINVNLFGCIFRNYKYLLSFLNGNSCDLYILKCTKNSLEFLSYNELETLMPQIMGLIIVTSDYNNFRNKLYGLGYDYLAKMLHYFSSYET